MTAERVAWVLQTVDAGDRDSKILGSVHSTEALVKAYAVKCAKAACDAANKELEERPTGQALYPELELEWHVAYRDISGNPVIESDRLEFPLSGAYYFEVSTVPLDPTRP